MSGQSTALAPVSEQTEKGMSLYDSRALTFNQILYIAKVCAASQLFKDVRDANQSVVKVLAGQELGLTPLVAMAKINIIQGKVSTPPEIMATLIKKSGEYHYEVIEHDETKCVIQFYHGDIKGYKSSYTMEDAKRAGLTGKENWKKFPRAMLYARALSQGARIECPHIINNCYTPDELGAVVTEQGEVISIENGDNGSGQTGELGKLSERLKKKREQNGDNSNDAESNDKRSFMVDWMDQGGEAMIEKLYQMASDENYSIESAVGTHDFMFDIRDNDKIETNFANLGLSKQAEILWIISRSKQDIGPNDVEDDGNGKTKKIPVISNQVEEQQLTKKEEQQKFDMGGDIL